MPFVGFLCLCLLHYNKQEKFVPVGGLFVSFSRCVFAPECGRSYLHITTLVMGSNQSSNYPIRSRSSRKGMCVLVVMVWVQAILSVNLCQAICIHNTARRGQKERERERDEQENRLKGTGNKWSGRKNKTRGREKEGQIRWQRTRQNEESVREGLRK